MARHAIRTSRGGRTGLLRPHRPRPTGLNRLGSRCFPRQTDSGASHEAPGPFSVIQPLRAIRTCQFPDIAASTFPRRLALSVRTGAPLVSPLRFFAVRPLRFVLAKRLCLKRTARRESFASRFSQGRVPSSRTGPKRPGRAPPLRRTRRRSWGSHPSQRYSDPAGAWRSPPSQPTCRFTVTLSSSLFSVLSRDAGGI